MSERGTAGGRGVVAVLVSLALLSLVAVAGILLLRPEAEPTAGSPPVAMTPSVPAAGPSTTTTPSAMKVARATTLAARPTCDRPTGGVTPTSVAIPQVTAGAGVVRPPRDSDDIPGTPPLSTAGKHLFAWDTAQGTRPGDASGNVLLNAHTWPDGSALGNLMLAHLFPGGRVVVEGDGARLCYVVEERVEVLASEGLARYYEVDGPHRLAILACSGRRLGPGDWEKRTVWFATPA